GVEQLEDRGVGADAERERQDGDDREAGGQAQQPQAVPQIAPYAVDKADGIHLIDLLSDQRRIPQLALRRRARGGRRHAARDVLVGLHHQMRLELASALVVPSSSAKKTFEGHRYW